MTRPDFVRYYLAPLLHATDSDIVRVDCDGETVRVVWINGESRDIEIGGCDERVAAISVLARTARNK